MRGKGGGQFSCKCQVATLFRQWTVLTVIVRTVSRPGNCMKIICPSYHPFPSKWCNDEFETRNSLRVFSFWLCGGGGGKVRAFDVKNSGRTWKVRESFKSLITFLLKCTHDFREIISAPCTIFLKFFSAIIPKSFQNFL